MLYPYRARLFVIDNLGTVNETKTAYFAGIEIQNFGEGVDEDIVTYPFAGLHYTNGAIDYIHADPKR